MPTCTACNTPNPDGTRFCMNCGQPLPSASVLGEAAQPPVSAPPAFNYAAPPPTAAARPLKDKSMALIFEILPGLFGIFGIGWIYAGNTSAGLLWLIGMLVWECLGGFVNVLLIAAAGIGLLGLLCMLPVNVVMIGVSAYSLNEYTKKRPELFG